MNVEADAADSPPVTRCLFCAEEIPAAAKKCRFCAEWQKPITAKEAPTKGFWEKLEIVGKILSILLIPIVLALLGNFVNTALKKSDVDLRMVELAVDILQEEPTEENKELRTWAIAVINKHAQVAITELAKNELLNKPLPETVPWQPPWPFGALNDSNPFRMSNVTFETVDASGSSVSGYEIVYVPVAYADDESMYRQLPGVTTTTTFLPPGNYLVWWRKNSQEGQKQSVSISKSAERIALMVDQNE